MRAQRDAIFRWIVTRPWSGFLTLEWRRRPDPENVPKLLRVLFSMVNRSMLGRNYPLDAGACVAWLAFLAISGEKVPHVHVLVGCRGQPEALRRAIQHAGNWWEARIGFVHYEAIRTLGAASMYVAQHFSDEGIELSSNLADWFNSV